jgi:guanylate kinase
MEFVIICGPSGSGKTFIKEYLCNTYRHTYMSVPQLTTREKRNGEQDIAYLFVSKNSYKNVEKFLIGKTRIYDNHYGSLMPSRKEYNQMKHVIILNKEGLNDFLSSINNNHTYTIIGITRDDLQREGRTEDYIEKEKEVLDMCDIVFDGKNGFVNPNSVHEYLSTL